MFILGTPAIGIIIRTTAVYLALLIGLRMAGKREIGQMTIFDLIVLLLISNSVQNAMVGEDSSLTGGILAAAVLLILNAVVAQMRMRWPRLRRLVEGSPTILVLHGKPVAQHLAHEGIDEETLESALREHGYADLKDVEMAVLEIDGSISIVPASAQTHRVKHVSKPLQHQ